MSKTIADLIALLPECDVNGATDAAITDVTADSRQIVPGAMFFCLTGARTDGHQYIAKAVEVGARCIVAEKTPTEPLPSDVTVVRVADTREAMKRMAPFFFDYPANQLRMIGVTGTNGKTTTTHMIRHLLMAQGKRVALLGTIHTLLDEEVRTAANTTPDVVDLQRLLAETVTRGITHVVMEVSSHAISLERIAGCKFDVAVLTNITQDHLDFHKTFEAYVAAKKQLFTAIKPSDTDKHYLVVNAADPSAADIVKDCTAPVFSYSRSGAADITAANVRLGAKDMSFDVTGGEETVRLQMAITGLFNVENVLAALSVAYHEGMPLESIGESLASFTGVPGRFELVEAGQPFTVVVDYAHTPDGLLNVIQTARAITEKHLIVVFGCGGDRDRTKRPIMGKLAAELADIPVLTSDNPRTEDPEKILDDVAAGVLPAVGQKQWWRIADRKEAIEKALALASGGDVVLIAGKGHETYQLIGGKTFPFDDRLVAKTYLEGKIW